MDPLPDQGPSDLEPSLGRCHENFVEAFRSFARHSPKCRIEEEAGAVRIAAGLATTAFNVVFITRPPKDPRRCIESAKEFMVREGISAWRLVAVDQAASSIETVAKEAGLSGRGSHPGMIWRPLPEEPPRVPSMLEIRPACTAELWETMIRVGLEGLNEGPWDPVDWVLPFDPNGRVRGYLGIVEGRPVSTSLGFSHAGVGGIFFVATLPGFRGRGFGTAMTARAAMDSRDEGCDVSYLQSTREGYSVYSKMGFRHVSNYSQWLPADDSSSGTSRG